MEGLGNQQHHNEQHQLHRTDEDEKRVQQQPGAFSAMATQELDKKEQGHGIGGIASKLNRSNSNSSSSSESDGEGGRRKKGIKDKIKDKIPGQHSQGQTETGQHGITGSQQGHGATGQHGEKEGVMDKIKDKISGNQ